ncbi:hypothetical protein B0H14DRAFT_3721576 [Mycena olivaceomarginata]|nr:hypothetical protein B0H14DRAFT_3721576 [Mycena olivaceomarginata]
MTLTEAPEPPPYIPGSTSEPLATRKHNEYYFEDGNLIIQSLLVTAGTSRHTGNFADIRDLAIRELGAFEMDPVEKIELQHRYHIKRQWAYSAYIALCSCPHALDIIEGRQLGIETTVSVAFAREKLDKWGRKKQDEVKKVVAEIFEISG